LCREYDRMLEYPRFPGRFLALTSLDPRAMIRELRRSKEH